MPNKDKGSKGKQSIEPYTKKAGKSVSELTKKVGETVSESTDESTEKDN